MPSLDKDDTPLLPTTVKWRAPSVHPEGRKFVVGAAFINLAVYFLVSHVLGALLLGITLWVAAFFRDPIRTTPRSDKLIIAPADGLITMITRVPPPLELRGAEPRHPELLQLLDALVVAEVGEVHGRLAALGARELQERATLGILRLRPPLGRGTHLLGRRRAHGGHALGARGSGLGHAFQATGGGLGGCRAALDSSP